MIFARHSAAIAVALFALAGCSRAGFPAGGEGAAPGKTVGYVRMDALIKKHPLYGQLAQFDANIEALNLKSVGPEVARSGADLARQEVLLQRELNDAAGKTQRLLKEKQAEYAKRETEAIRNALGNGAVGGGGAAIAGSMQRTYQDQANRVSAEAQSNFAKYRQSLILQDQAAANALSKSLAERADRTYRAKADELSQKESAYALDIASKDSAARLSLRTKLSNLALDDAAREDVRAQLAALDRKEADAIAALRNRDAATLGALQTQLRASTKGEIERAVVAIHQRTNDQLRARENAARTQVQTAIRSMTPNLTPGAGGPVAQTTGIPPDARAKIESLHKEYQAKFQRDAEGTIRDFKKTRDDLQRRFNQLHGADAGAQAGARKQIETLQRQRGDLYGQMVAQIGREVRLVAKSRGISIVFTDIVAPAGGVDLTADAEKDIESLHE